jgi:L-alanine-DL-glutamate epimerase-like enolase superfamily enzyme
MDSISRIELYAYAFQVPGLGLGGHGAMGVSNYEYKKDASLAVKRLALKIITDDGIVGEYGVNWGSTDATFGQICMLAPHLIGRDPEAREEIYDDLKRELRAYDRMGLGPLDIALWDLAGKKYNTSVSKLLGGYRKTIPAYASTHHGQEGGGGLDSPQAFADFTRHCRSLGYRALKIHGWHNGDVRREIENSHKVREAVGDDMDLMNDPGCQLRTWSDALKLGYALDEAHYLWYEDPYRDASAAAHGHKLLREKLKTPLMLTEYVRGVESTANFVLAGATDMIHIDPEYDGGITGARKIAHFCEAIGLDVQCHACGPAQRALISSLRNTLYYEMALVGPDMPNLVAPVYADDYRDQLDAVDADGCVGVPDGPGLGVTLDWDYIAAHQVEHRVFGG